MNIQFALMVVGSVACILGAVILLVSREANRRFRWYELLLASAGAAAALGALAESDMKRVSDTWGIVILTAGCAVILLSFCLPLRASLSTGGRKKQYVASSKVAALLIAFSSLVIPGGPVSALVFFGCLVPPLVVSYYLVRLSVGVIRRTGVYRSLTSIFIYSALASAGAVGAVVVTLPEPFVAAAEVSLGQHLPPAKGWSDEQLGSAFRHAEELGSSAVIVIQDGQLVAEWGSTSKRTDAHSIRKSILSALFGIAEQKGLIDLDSTLKELGINDENPTLTNEERRAKVLHLLTSTSGIYHDYVGDEEGNRPEPGSHDPGAFFFYNNWSFNALGTVFEQETGLTIGDALQQWIAIPTGMQDFREDDVRYVSLPKPFASNHKAYRIWISARDLARFGLLFQQNGTWQGKRILPEGWIRRSTSAYTKSGRFGYGYSWWRSLGDPDWVSDEAYFSTGTGGQKLLVDPVHKLVVVHRTDTRSGAARGLWMRIGAKVNNGQFLELTRRILLAQPAES